MTRRTNQQQDSAIDSLQQRVNELQSALALLRGERDASDNALGEVSRLTANIQVSTNDAPAIDATAGGSQRLRFYVPTERTTMTLGRYFTDRTLSGFGVNTNGHVFLNAGDGEHGSSTASVQAQGQVLVQSVANNVHVLSQANGVIGAAGSVYVSGGGGLYLGAGHPISTNTMTGGSAPPPNGLSGGLSTLETFNRFWAATDATVAASMFARTAMINSTAPAWSGSFTNKAAVLLAHSAAAACSVHSGGVALMGASPVSKIDAVSVLNSGVGMYGAGGVLVGTPLFCSLYGAAGAVLGSVYPLVFGLETEVHGARTVSVTSLRNACVVARNDAEVLARKTARLASRTASAWVEGKKVNLGNYKNVSAPQMPTEQAVVEARDSVDLKSDQQVTIDVGTFRVLVNTKGVWIGRSGGADAPEATEQLVEVTDGGIRLRAGEKHWIEVTPKAIVQSVENAVVSLDRSKVEVVAPTVEVGGQTAVKIDATSVKVGGNALVVQGSSKTKQKRQKKKRGGRRKRKGR